jgi:hypothetical protein
MVLVMRNLIYTLLIGLAFNQVAYATSTTVVADGEWSDGATWDNGVPGCFDTIVVPASMTVTITATVDLEACDTIVIEVYGFLQFQTGKKLQLPCGTKVNIYSGGSLGVGGGGGSSTYLEFCADQCWNASAGDISGPFVLISGNCVSLPVELVSFTATMNTNQREVDLDWQTASESNNDYFTIERSKFGDSWEEVNQIAGAGNSSVNVYYHDVDVQPFYGESYYRLKQTDFDGQFEYSAAVRVNHFDITEIAIYPNPINQNDNIIINFPKDFEVSSSLQMFSLDGKLVYESVLSISGSQQKIINIGEQFAPGVYTIKIDNLSTKLVVQ